MERGTPLFRPGRPGDCNERVSRDFRVWMQVLWKRGTGPPSLLQTDEKGGRYFSGP